jgi:hypothetical protein
MTEQPIVSIILALFALAGTIGGVRTGRYMERSNEATKWRRDRCLEADADVLATCHVVLNEANNAWVMDDPTTPQAIAQNAVLISKVTEMYRAADKASLIGSREIDIPLRRLTDHYCQEIARRAAIPKPPKDEWHKIVREAGDLYGTFVVLARKDLGFVPDQATAKDQILHFDQSLLCNLRNRSTSLL